MIRMLQSTCRVWDHESTYLHMVMAIFILLPIAYGAYLLMDAMMLQTSIAVILNDNAVEAINLLINLSGVYSAYAIYQYNQVNRNKSCYLAILILLIAQICFLNYVGALLLIIYVSRFIGWKKTINTYKKAASGRTMKVLLPALLVCLIAFITLGLKLQLGLLC